MTDTEEYIVNREQYMDLPAEQDKPEITATDDAITKFKPIIETLKSLLDIRAVGWSASGGIQVHCHRKQFFQVFSTSEMDSEYCHPNYWFFVSVAGAKLFCLCDAEEIRELVRDEYCTREEMLAVMPKMEAPL